MYNPASLSRLGISQPGICLHGKLADRAGPDDQIIELAMIRGVGKSR